MVNVKFIKKSAKASIVVRVRLGRKIDWSTTTNLFIAPEDWDANIGMPKKNIRDGERYKRALIIKKQLSEIETKIQDLFTNYQIHSIVKQDLIQIINPSLAQQNTSSSTNDEDKDLIAYIKDNYITDPNKQLKEGSIKHAHTVISLLSTFSAEEKYELKHKNINKKFIQLFQKWMYNKKYSPNYLGRTMKAIKGYCRHWSQSFDLPLNKDINNIKVKFNKTCYVVLNKEELLQIYNSIMPHDYLENAKQWLIISCVTGQRVSDFLNFQNKQLIYDNIINRNVLCFTQKKTNKEMKIPIHSELFNEIYSKNNNNFPRKISAVNYNQYIKEVCRIAGLTQLVEGEKIDPKTNRKVKGMYPKYELVSSHIGRRSFATMYYGVLSVQVLMYATGHQSINSFMKYINKTEDEKMMALNQELMLNNKNII